MTWPPHGGEHASEAGPPSKQRERTGGGLKARSSLGSAGGRDSSVEGAPISEIWKWRWRALWKKGSRRHRILTMKGRDRERPWTRSPASARVEQTRTMARLDDLEALHEERFAWPTAGMTRQKVIPPGVRRASARRRLGIERWLRTQRESLEEGSPSRPRGPLWGSRAESRLGVLVDN